MSLSTWSYSESGFGPSRWKERYTAAKGKYQSPVNVETKDVELDEHLGSLSVFYNEACNSTLTNDGRTLQVTLTDQHQVISGGPLSHQYRLAIIRFHWGTDSHSGSEHLIDGSPFPLEVQLIHWNQDLYKNMGEAVIGDDGICIVGMLFQVGDEEHMGLKPIIDLMSRDNVRGCFSLEVKSAIDLSHFIPGGGNFWTYRGSLTTPPLTENVSWIVFQETWTLSSHQMEVIRNVQNSKGDAMTDNSRPVCPLNGRVIRASSMLENNNSVFTVEDSSI